MPSACSDKISGLFAETIETASCDCGDCCKFQFSSLRSRQMFKPINELDVISVHVAENSFDVQYCITCGGLYPS